MDILVFTMPKNVEINKYTVFYHKYNDTLMQRVIKDTSICDYFKLSKNNSILPTEYDSLYRIKVSDILRLLKHKNKEISNLINELLIIYLKEGENINFYIQFD